MSSALEHRQEMGAAHVAAVDLVETLVAERETSGDIDLGAVFRLVGTLTPQQQNTMLVSLADMASAALAAWRKRDIVGADLYLAMRRMLADRIGAEEDELPH
jgi:hypothetical protein